MGKGGEVTAVAELAVQFTGFKNVDLFSQGIYQMRVRAIGERSRRHAVPYSYSEGVLPEEVVGSQVNTEPLLPAHVLDRTGDFCTPSFRIRYCDEEVVLRSLARLRIELSLVAPSDAEAEDAVPEEVLLEVRLLHARSTTKLDASGDVEKQSSTHFNVVCTQTLRLLLPLRGGSAVHPLTFDDWHFCLSPLLVHAALLEFKLRAAPSLAPPPPPRRKRSWSSFRPAGRWAWPIQREVRAG